MTIETLPEWAGWKAWYEIDKVRAHLEAYRILHEGYGDHPGFHAALDGLGISHELRTAYLDAAKLLQERGF